jgi:GalNAc-alpha-(1->4)-GalNAc-alpha-(1->3)-diNAcBac-PP-undecaprenol alpha-1,4-N-acetyl-D-galactosaminyltransferase
MSLKKICLVIPSLHSGGMERVMSELAGYFCRQSRIEVHIVMYGNNPETFYLLSQNLVIHQPDWKFDNTKRKWHTLKRMLYLRRTIKKIDPITILSFGEYWNSFVLMSLTGLRYPIFVSDRCQPDKRFGFIQVHLRRWLYPKATGIIAQTSVAQKIYLKQFYHSDIKVIGNPIRKIKTNSEKIKRDNIVLSVGRLIASKHHDLLIDIFIKIGKPDWKLIIVGGNAIQQNGTERLTAKIKELHAEDQVILTGNISNVEDYYLKSKIFAFTSSSEGFPNVIGEAMAAGLPVVAFDCVAGPAEMIEDSINGYLVPLFDNEWFERKLKELMGNESQRIKMGVAARYSIEKFSVESIGKAYFSFIMQQN